VAISGNRGNLIIFIELNLNDLWNWTEIILDNPSEIVFSHLVASERIAIIQPE
jgi:hypothetical protein